jgi:hypothetical protein
VAEYEILFSISRRFRLPLGSFFRTIGYNVAFFAFAMLLIVATIIILFCRSGYRRAVAEVAAGA